MEIACVDCAICGSNDNKILFIANDYRLHTTRLGFNLVKCKKCGLVYVNPQPMANELNKFYPTGYHKPNSAFWERIYALVGKRVFGRLVCDIKRYKGRGKILDVGCGRGVLLKVLQDEGYEVYGVDPSSEAVATACSGLEDKIWRGTLRSCDFETAFFDIVILKQVLEHLPNPNGELLEVNRILKPDGILYIEVPNFYCPEARLFGKYWYNLEIPRHLYQCSLATLTGLLKNSDFEPLAVLRNGGWMIFKSPLAIVNSFKFYLDATFGNKLAKTVFIPFFIPLLLFTPLLRVASSFTPGMDIRVVFSKCSEKYD